MGLLQAAYRTYEVHAHLAGIVEENKEALSPVSHMIQNAKIEITIDLDGCFQSASTVSRGEEKTIIPVTLESANRVSSKVAPHPLSDQLQYLASYGGDKYDAYLAQLTKWTNSDYSHPKARAVLRYIQGGTIVDDLLGSSVITGERKNIKSTKFNKYMIRWRVVGARNVEKTACWEDQTLFQCFIDFYAHQCADKKQDICLITGERDLICEAHPKGVVVSSFGAKLLSANDSSGFTYRGRFTKGNQAYNVGYTASQKSHHALRWVADNQGVILGGRTFLCWNPEGSAVPTSALFALPSEEKVDLVGYKKLLLSTLGGYRNALKDSDDVVIAALDAATTGRLSVTYYNELKASDFLDRIEHWYTTCCWDSRFYGVQAPALRRIVECAFGTQRGNFIEVDSRISREYIQRLLHCVISRQPVGPDIVTALVTKCSKLLPYTISNREVLLTTTCAIVRKYRNDRYKEEWDLALNVSNQDRSYLFGRLLAVTEQVERSTYDRNEERETNAIRMQSVFSQRPLYAWRIIEEKLTPYFSKLPPGLRAYYKSLIGEIIDKLPDSDDPELGKKLSDTYLLGYYQQRTALDRKKETAIKEDSEDERIEE